MLEFGIDTLGILAEKQDFSHVVGVRVSERDREDNKEYIIVKPSELSGKTGLSTFSETLEYLIYLRGEIMGDIEIKRLDHSRDILEKLKENEKMYIMFLEILSLKRGEKGIFRTEKNIVETGNLKIKTRREETTIYNCEDKERCANTRLENRSLDIRYNAKDKKKIETEIKKSVNELKEIEDLIPMVEKRYIKILTKHYFDTLESGEIRNFTDFIVECRSKILTVDILKGLYKNSELKGNFKSWYEKYRKNRELKLIKKSEIKKFIKGNIKGYKGVLKS